MRCRGLTGGDFAGLLIGLFIGLLALVGLGSFVMHRDPAAGLLGVFLGGVAIFVFVAMKSIKKGRHAIEQRRVTWSGSQTREPCRRLEDADWGNLVWEGHAGETRTLVDAKGRYALLYDFGGAEWAGRRAVLGDVVTAFVGLPSIAFLDVDSKEELARLKGGKIELPDGAKYRMKWPWRQLSSSATVLQDEHGQEIISLTPVWSDGSFLIPQDLENVRVTIHPAARELKLLDTLVVVASRQFIDYVRTAGD